METMEGSLLVEVSLPFDNTKLLLLSDMCNYLHNYFNHHEQNFFSR